MVISIFYSWQSDLLPHDENKDLIKRCLESALSSVKQTTSLLIDPRLDSDTIRTAGSPDIAATVFEKIGNCQIFIADISIINKNDKGRKTPNPNVLIELGYAIAIVGWSRIILLFNETTGAESDVPFDLRGRKIIRFTPGVNSGRFISTVKLAIESSLPELPAQAREQLGVMFKPIHEIFANIYGQCQSLCCELFEDFEDSHTDESLDIGITILIDKRAFFNELVEQKNISLREMNDDEYLLKLNNSHTTMTYSDAILDILSDICLSQLNTYFAKTQSMVQSLKEYSHYLSPKLQRTISEFSIAHTDSKEVYEKRVQTINFTDGSRIYIEYLQLKPGSLYRHITAIFKLGQQFNLEYGDQRV